MQTRPDWMNGLSNLRREHGFEPLRVEGRLPPALRGTLYRNGAGIFDRFGERCRHWFDADAALTAVRFDGEGGAQGATRVHRTPAFHREEAAGRRLFGGWNTPLARPLRELLLRDGKNPSSTSVMFFGGQLLSLCEGGKPVVMDPERLERIAETDLGAIRAGFGAHPHAARGAIWNIGAHVGPRTRLTVYEMRERVRAVSEIVVDRPVFIHDFVATERHLLIPAAPWRLDLWKIAFHGAGVMDSAAWLPRPAELFVVPLDEPTRVRRIEVEPHLLEHVIAARDEGQGRVRAWITRYPSLEARDGFLRGLVHGAPERPLGSRVSCLVVDLDRGEARFEDLGSPGAELPSAEGDRAYAVGYRAEGTRAPWDAIVELDLERGEQTSRWDADGYPGEPIVAGEHLLTLVYVPRVDASCLAVLHRDRIADGPIARVYFEQPIPFGFHGCWLPS